MRRAAEATLNGAHVRLVVTPEKPLRASSDESLDRTAMPSAGGARPASPPPTPRSLRLSNGIPVRFARKPGVPMVAVRAVVRAGAIMDPPDSPGLSNFAASMLPEGTANRTSQQIAAQMEFLGAHLGVDVAREHSVVSTAALTSHWEAALDILADSLRNAAFPEFDLKRMRERHLTDLRRVADNPASIAARASRGLVYGPNSAYGHPVSGTEDVIRERFPRRPDGPLRGALQPGQHHADRGRRSGRDGPRWTSWRPLSATGGATPRPPRRPTPPIRHLPTR